jgi:myosin tail region-interacting protein MTI1
LLRLTRPRNDSDTLPWSPENGEAFKVKAVLGYTSPHDDDLHFSDGQIIRVTNQEDEEWYMGEYMDASGVKHEGTFPKHFVEKYGL